MHDSPRWPSSSVRPLYVHCTSTVRPLHVHCIFTCIFAVSILTCIFHVKNEDPSSPQDAHNLASHQLPAGYLKQELHSFKKTCGGGWAEARNSKYSLTSYRLRKATADSMR